MDQEHLNESETSPQMPQPPNPPAYETPHPGAAAGAIPPPADIPDFSYAMYDAAPRKKGSGWKVFWGIVLALSIIMNGFLLLVIFGMGAALAGGGIARSQDEGVVEHVLFEGARSRKIAILTISGIIDDRQADWFRRQIETAEKDSNVRALMVLIDSPGGAVSSSDQIHYYISRYKERTGKPVLAFMQSMAASGGYYSAVACDQIIAEPTVITGSIGVIMNHLVIKDLLEQKLGVNPVTLKTGKHKDWPSMFNQPTDEEKQYLMDRVLTPAYNRFVQLVQEGRSKSLTEAEVLSLADGSIFTATEALDKKLIDRIGYIDEAREMAEEMANISNALVVRYQEVFSFWSLLGAQSKKQFSIDSEILEKVTSPKLMYLWDGRP
ncbi:MAG: signal peptide peptidase SppA [Planctomycetaceae bacterium]|nr:signal peptide peptidase SppA [Planctomycetaceae bacterium]